MAILSLQTGDATPVLRAVAQPIQRFDAALRRLARDMHETMINADGVGLAAPQIGTSLRLFVVHPDYLPLDILTAMGTAAGKPVVVANPIVTRAGSGVEAAHEGCLSLPGITVDVPRSRHFTVRAQNIRGESFTVRVSGFPARIFQHELDHLEGTLISDRGPIVQPHTT